MLNRNYLPYPTSLVLVIFLLQTEKLPSAFGMWSLGLLKTMKNPEYVVFQDQKVVMIKDLYPKARHHFLVIPNEDIASIRMINENHIPLLEHMECKAKEYVAKVFPNINFR